MADWNGFKKNGTTYIPNDSTARGWIGTLSNLATTVKTNIVAAINELVTSISKKVGWADYAKTGVHNMLPIKISDVKSWNGGTWTGNTCELAGCTFVCHVDDLGYVTQIDVSGTATTDIYFGIYKAYGKDSFLGQNVIMSGCPVGGSSSTYLLSGYRLGSIDGSSGSVIDVGSGVKFDFLNNGSGTRGTITITVLNGVTIPSVVSFFPMIRLSSDTDPTFAPYAMTNRELTDAVTKQTTQATNFAEGITVNDSAGGNYVEKVNSVVFVSLGLSGVTSSGDTTIGNIPNGFRPTHNVYFTAKINDGTPLQAYITEGGNIKVGSVSNRTIMINTSFCV